jgi:hypothetical protein
MYHRVVQSPSFSLPLEKAAPPFLFSSGSAAEKSALGMDQSTHLLFNSHRLLAVPDGRGIAWRLLYLNSISRRLSAPEQSTDRNT